MKLQTEMLLFNILKVKQITPQKMNEWTVH